MLPALCKVMSWDVSKHLHSFMLIHPLNDKVGYLLVRERGDIGIGSVSGEVFIDGESYAGVESAELAQNECCVRPSPSFPDPCEMLGAVRPYFVASPFRIGPLARRREAIF